MDNIGNIIYTMNTGRDDYAYRSCVSENSAEWNISIRKMNNAPFEIGICNLHIPVI